MSNYLIRGGCNVMNDNFNNIIVDPDCRVNIGALLFPYSTINTIVKPDDKFIVKGLGPKTIKYINQHYIDKHEIDYLVLPMADAIRNVFIDQLNGITAAIKHIDVPCICTSIGTRKDFFYDPVKSFTLKEKLAAERFINTILTKSNSFGVRGELSAQFFESLGCIRDKDFYIVGCPAMYANGPELRARELTSNVQNVAVNANPCIMIYGNQRHMIPIFNNSINDFNNVNIYPSYTFEYRLAKDLENNNPLPLLKNIIVEIQKNNINTYDYLRRFACYDSVPSIIDSLKKYDLCFGNRMHGCIYGILAGVPTLCIASDWRMVELCDYYNIQYIKATDLHSNIQDIMYNYDYTKIQEGYKEKFQNYIHFLNRNGIQTNYDKIN